MRRKIPRILQRLEVAAVSTPKPFEMSVEGQAILARASALNTVELLETKFESCSQIDLVLNIQQVCRR